MAIPVVNLRPFGRLDAQGRVIPSSFGNLAYQSILNGSSQLAYVGFARPGASVDDAVWQIFYIQYTSDIPTSITWPQDGNGNASNDFQFVFSDYASYTYS